MSAPATDTGSARGHHVLRHWPIALGLATATFQLATRIKELATAERSDRKVREGVPPMGST